MVDCLQLQRVVRVKKTDEAEDDDSDLTEDEIQALSQGQTGLTYTCISSPSARSVRYEG